ncbi:hypothetical protein FQR65_LT13519 [Abscondita terminalis]|nr:hypothetical protein FQR65_LT13519 [Abscondita terminalis]
MEISKLTTVPIPKVKMMCRRCRQDILLIPIKYCKALYQRGFNVEVLIKLILHGHQFFLCQQCCEILSQKTICAYGLKHNNCICALVDFQDASFSLSVFEDPYKKINQQCVCAKCMGLLVGLRRLYNEFNQEKFNFSCSVMKDYQITPYLCTRKTLLNVIRPILQLHTFYHPLKSIDVHHVEYIMRSTSIYKKGRKIIRSSSKFQAVLADLKSIRVVYQCLAEVTKYVTLEKKPVQEVFPYDRVYYPEGPCCSHWFGIRRH